MRIKSVQIILWPFQNATNKQTRLEETYLFIKNLHCQQWREIQIVTPRNLSHNITVSL